MQARRDAEPVGGIADTLVTSEGGRFLETHYVEALGLIGLLILLIAWLPLLLKRVPLSVPIVCVGLGWALFEWTALSRFSLHPLRSPLMIERAAELIVIVSLFGAGLKIDRAFTWANWGIAVRLLAIAMPLTILAAMALGVGLLALSLPAALLLAAALAPTDPVLASDIQVERPDSEYDDEARFALTKEAGLNDALAFPFVHLAIAASLSGWGVAMWSEWALDAVLLRLTVGCLVGIAAGKLLGTVIYRLPSHSRLARSGAGFVAVGATLAVYAGTELLHGYGFLAVFVAGLMLRRAAPDDGYNHRMHDFADESERLLMLLLLILFGGMLASDDIFAGLGPGHVAFAIALLLVVRPLAALIGMAGVDRPWLEKGIIAFFGIRGLGSVYYLAYGLNHADFAGAESMWAALALVILASILLHGILVTPAMRRLDRMHGAATNRAPPD